MNDGQLLQEYERWLRIHRHNSESTIKEMLNKTKSFLDWLGDKDIKEADQKTVDEYLARCIKKYRGNTVRVITANLRKLLMHYLKLPVEIKIYKRSAPDRDKTPLTREQVKELFKAVEHKPLWHAILKTLYYGGMRRQELVDLDLEDIDKKRLQLHIRHGKGDKGRVVNVTEDCIDAIMRYIAVRKKPREDHEHALFISRNRRRISAGAVMYVIKEAAAASGINMSVYPHKMRITNITQMAESNLSLAEIMAQSGHSTISVLLGYIQHSPQRIRQQYEKAFNDVDTSNIDVPETPVNPEHYKRLATKKYLDGEIDHNTLNSILSTIDDTQEGRNRDDPAYR